MQRTTWSTLLTLTLASTASADLVHLRSGHTLEGKVEHTPAGIRVTHPAGVVTVDPSQVLRVEPRETPWDMIDRRLDDLRPGDLAQAFDLAERCLELGHPDRVPAILLRALPPGDLLAAVHVAQLYREHNLERHLPDLAHHTLPPLLDDLQPGQLVPGSHVARFAAHCDAPALLDLTIRRVQRPGHLDDAAVLGMVCADAQVYRLLPHITARALDAPLQGDPDSGVALARASAAHDAEPSARALLLELARLHPSHPGTLAALRDLGFHREAGAWIPPERYYPSRGYVLHDGDWVLPQRRDYLRAQDAHAQAIAQEDQARAVTWRTRHAQNDADNARERAHRAARRAHRDLQRAEARWLDNLATLRQARADVDAADCWFDDPCRTQGSPGYVGAWNQRAQAARDLDAAQRDADLALAAFRDAQRDAHRTQAQAERADRDHRRAQAAYARARAVEQALDDDVDTTRQALRRARSHLADELERRGN